ncbi:hypothetical protein GDO86_015989 [Hymenochirus boettgeri]|uniref:SH3 domain-containing protein n=1 Tax=Hymenochirus boettgeri TaxID=247094 RepID=A0A8T2K3C3_9PIPI|nr:hypothetical protein GDO86_015989 [Hymenochirus boettgeri]
MLRAQAVEDYKGPDCRFLSFRAGEEINVYYKLSGKRKDLWQGSTGKEYGFFPSGTVSIEEVFVTEEIEVTAQEIDFVCLNGGEYVFENEESTLHKYEEGDNTDDMDIKDIDDKKNTGSSQSENNVRPSDILPDRSAWTDYGIAGWFGKGETENQKNGEVTTETLNDETIQTKTIAISIRNEIERDKDVQSEKSGWIGDQLTQLLSFGKNEVGKPQKNPIDGLPSSETSQKDDTRPSEWFSFRFKDVLGVGSENEQKMHDAHQIEDENDKTQSSIKHQSIDVHDGSMPYSEHKDTKDILVADHIDKSKGNTKYSEDLPARDKIDVESKENGGSADSEKYHSFKHINSKERGVEFTFQNILLISKSTNNKHHISSDSKYKQSLWYRHIMENLVSNKDGKTEQSQCDFGESNNEISAQDPKETKLDEADNKGIDFSNFDIKEDQQMDNKDSQAFSEVLQNTIENHNLLAHKSTDKRPEYRHKFLSKDPTELDKNNFTLENKPTIKIDTSSPQEKEDTFEKIISGQVNKYSTYSISKNKVKKKTFQSTFKTDRNSPKQTYTEEVSGIKDIETKKSTQEKATKEISFEKKHEGCSLEATEKQDSPLKPEQITNIDSDVKISLEIPHLIKEPKCNDLRNKMQKEENMKSVAIENCRENEIIGGELSSDFESLFVDGVKYIQSKKEQSKYYEHRDHQGESRSRVHPREHELNKVVQEQKLDSKMEKILEYASQSHKGKMYFVEMVSSKLLEVYSNFIRSTLSLLTGINKITSSLLELHPDSSVHRCFLEMVVLTVIGLSTVLLFTCRAIKSVKSRCYAGREKKLGAKFAEALNEKSEVLEKLSVIQKQHEDVQQSLEGSSQQQLFTKIAMQKELQTKLQESNFALEEKILELTQELEEEKTLGQELDNELSEIQEKIKTLEEGFKKERSQKDEIRTTMKVYEINQGRLETSFQDTIEEKSRLQESIKQLSEEAEGWEERLSELTENSKMLSSSVDVMYQDMNSKLIQIKSLIDSLLKMKDWGSEMEEVEEADDTSMPSLKWDFENGEPLGDPQKRTIKKLIYAAMLNASLRSIEAEKKQLYDNLSDEMKIKEQLLECINNLQNTKQSLVSEKTHLEDEAENLKQKMSVMSEMYQENERKLHRKLTVQERERMQKEEKLSKVDEKINLATGELYTVRTRVKELEEEIEKTVCSCQSQVTSYEKKSHDNWLTARAAERYLSDLKKETSHFRQKLTEAEYKLELLEKDPFALDVIHAIGRDSSPYGLSPISRLSESRAFLSPPTLLEGPLRLSPMLSGADRGIRPPVFYPAYLGPKDRGDTNADRKSDHQRTLSDAGSLSPPWEREHKANLPPPGYTESPFAQRRPERFYHYPVPSGRYSGPAELTRNQGKPFLDHPDGQSSPENKLRANTSKNDSENNDNLHDSSSQPPSKEGEAVDVPPMGYTFYPPPLQIRVPLLPMDPRGPYFRRPFPMPPPPVDMYPPPNYPGMLPIHCTRGPIPPQRYPPPFAIHGEPFFPPHTRPPIRNEHSSDPSLPVSEMQDQPSQPENAD